MTTRLDRQDKFLCSNTGGIFWDKPNHFRGCKQLCFYFSITLCPLKKNSRGHNMVFQLSFPSAWHSTSSFLEGRSILVTYSYAVLWRVWYIGDIHLRRFMMGVVCWWHTSMLFHDGCVCWWHTSTLFHDGCCMLVTCIYAVSRWVLYAGDVHGCCMLVTYIYAVSRWVLYAGDVHLRCFMIGVVCWWCTWVLYAGDVHLRCFTMGVVCWWHASTLLAAAWGEVARHSRVIHSVVSRTTVSLKA